MGALRFHIFRANAVICYFSADGIFRARVAYVRTLVFREKEEIENCSSQFLSRAINSMSNKYGDLMWTLAGKRRVGRTFRRGILGFYSAQNEDKDAYTLSWHSPQSDLTILTLQTKAQTRLPTALQSNASIYTPHTKYIQSQNNMNNPPLVRPLPEGLADRWGPSHPEARTHEMIEDEKCKCIIIVPACLWLCTLSGPWPLFIRLRRYKKRL